MPDVNKLKQIVKVKTQAGKKYFPAIFFIVGFLFDIFTLGRIDNQFTILFQAIYLAFIAVILALEFLFEDKLVQSADSVWLSYFFKYEKWVLHFLFGSLLSAYTIFYFKSASFWSSFLFLAFLALILLLNEMEFIQKGKRSVAVILFALCLSSYFIYVLPILMGSISAVLFYLAIFLSFSVNLLFYFLLFRRLKSKYIFFQQMLLPMSSIHLAFLILYLFAWIPPVPISIQYLGIYHSVEREEGRYKLGYTRSKWKFWQNGDQDFVANKGDKIWCFARIFSPANFKEKIFIHWLFKNKKNQWEKRDIIPIQITGGRQEGFRGRAYKSNYEAGEWQIRLATEDEREIGRISFHVSIDSEDSEIVKKFEYY